MKWRFEDYGYIGLVILVILVLIGILVSAFIIDYRIGLIIVMAPITPFILGWVAVKIWKLSFSKGK